MKRFLRKAGVVLLKFIGVVFFYRPVCYCCDKCQSGV